MMEIHHWHENMDRRNWRKRLWRKAIELYWKRERGGYAYTSPDGREVVEESATYPPKGGWAYKVHG